MPSPLDAFVPTPDLRERFHTRIRAPHDLVMKVATTMDLPSLPLMLPAVRREAERRWQVQSPIISP